MPGCDGGAVTGNRLDASRRAESWTGAGVLVETEGVVEGGGAGVGTVAVTLGADAAVGTVAWSRARGVYSVVRDVCKAVKRLNEPNREAISQTYAWVG